MIKHNSASQRVAAPSNPCSRKASGGQAARCSSPKQKAGNEGLRLASCVSSDAANQFGKASAEVLTSVQVAFAPRSRDLLSWKLLNAQPHASEMFNCWKASFATGAPNRAGCSPAVAVLRRPSWHVGSKCTKPPYGMPQKVRTRGAVSCNQATSSAQRPIGPKTQQELPASPEGHFRGTRRSRPRTGPLGACRTSSTCEMQDSKLSLAEREAIRNSGTHELKNQRTHAHIGSC